MGTGDILLGGNSAMDQHPIQGGVAIFLGLLHANETGISSGRLGLCLVCAFTYIALDISKRLKLPQDDRQIQILQRRLECISIDLKVLWIALKSVFNEFRRKPSLGAPEKIWYQSLNSRNRNLANLVPRAFPHLFVKGKALGMRLVSRKPSRPGEGGGEG